MNKEYMAVTCVLLVLVAYFIIKKAKPSIFSSVNRDMVSIAMFILLLIMIARHFYTHGYTVGLVAVGLGAIALGKYAFDSFRERGKE